MCIQILPVVFYMSDKNNKIYKVFKEHKGFARTKDILSAGIHHRDIKKFMSKGLIQEVKRGLYRLSDGPLVSNQSFIDLSFAVPEGVICLLSALSYYEITTFNPSIISMAICRGTRKPKIDYPPVNFYYFSKRQFEIGIIENKIGNYKFRIYNIEKTICDCFRYRNKLGIDIVKESLMEYLKRKDRNLEKLIEFAEICRVKTQLKIWLEAMI